jgi:hypothetical protein
MSTLSKDHRMEKRPETAVRGRRWIIVTVALLLGATTTFWLNSPLFTASEYRSPTCGTTSMEARERGCQYEPMFHGWIPQDCYTVEPGDEYHPFDDRTWYFDKALTRPIEGRNLDALHDGYDLTAYTKTFHDEHCLYAWRKLHLAVEKRLKLVDSKTMSLHHTTHCSQRIAKLIYNVGNWGYNESLAHTSTAPLLFLTCVQPPWIT